MYIDPKGEYIKYMDISKVIVFYTNHQEYGFPIEHVISIEKLETINSIPNMPFYMRGTVMVKGELLPVLDMNRIFYDQDTRYDENTKLIVAQSEDLTAALIVNEAKEILDIQESQLKSLSLGAFQAAKYFPAVATIDERLISIINPNSLFSSLEGISLVKAEINRHQ